MKRIATVVLLVSVLILMACSQRDNVSYKNDVKKALEQAELKDVTVSEDQDDELLSIVSIKAKAEEIARAAASPRIIANEISVQPVGSESQAKAVASNLDEGIDKNYRAALISSGLDKQHITFDAKNGLLTLTGSVHNTTDRQRAEKLASGIPNVQQVLNQIQVRR